MDNLPAHKPASIAPMIEAVCESSLFIPIPPNPIELWWSQLKSFTETTTEMIDKLIVALDLINPQHLKNWFTKHCTS